MSDLHTCPECGTEFEGIGVHCRNCLLVSLRASKERGTLVVLYGAGADTGHDHEETT